MVMSLIDANREDGVSSRSAGSWRSPRPPIKSMLPGLPISAGERLVPANMTSCPSPSSVSMMRGPASIAHARSFASDRGRAYQPLKWRPCAWSISSTIIACSALSGISNRSMPKRTIMWPEIPSIWLYDANETASGSPGRSCCYWS